MCFAIKKIYLSEEPDEGDPESQKNFNTDVIVLTEEEDEESEIVLVKYVASFFTYSNLHDLQARHEKTGENLNGKYFYARNMVLVNECSISNIEVIIRHMIDEGEFREAFRKI